MESKRLLNVLNYIFIFIIELIFQRKIRQSLKLEFKIKLQF